MRVPPKILAASATAAKSGLQHSAQLPAHNTGKLDKSHTVLSELLRGVNPCVSAAIESQNSTAIPEGKRNGHHVVGAAISTGDDAIATHAALRDRIFDLIAQQVPFVGIGLAKPLQGSVPLFGIHRRDTSPTRRRPGERKA